MNFFLSLLLLATVNAADITLQTADGVSISANVEVVKGAKKGVLFVHGDGRTSQDWQFLVTKAKIAGMSAVAIDLRGHGKSGGVLPEADYGVLTQDLDAGLCWLRNNGASSLMIVGADIGANLALNVAANSSDVTNLVLLSPGLKYRGVKVTEALNAYNPRPIFIAVSRDDAYSAKSALVLDAQASGPKHIELLTSAGRGATMLNREPSLEGLIQSWLLGTNQIAGEATLSREIDVTAEEDIKTTGPSLSGR